MSVYKGFGMWSKSWNCSNGKTKIEINRMLEKSA